MEEDRYDYREFKKTYDSNHMKKLEMLEDVFQQLKNHKMLSKNLMSMEVADMVDVARNTNGLEMQFMGLTEYGREVHAEMDALVGAARSHVSVKGCTMYCTTFPCHMCAKHIVASGIDTLVFIEPYPKSHAKELFADSISVGGKRRQKNKVVFKPYIGIAPSQYMHLFKMDQRKHEETGRAVKWNPLKSAPRRWRRVEPVGEQTSLEELHRLMKKKGLRFRDIREARRRSRR